MFVIHATQYHKDNVIINKNHAPINDIRLSYKNLLHIFNTYYLVLFIFHKYFDGFIVNTY